MTTMNINHEQLLPDNCFFKNATKKNLVVLHFTAGRLALPAIETFKRSPAAQGYPVSTQYVVGLDGVIYRLFDDKYWSYHLGIQGHLGQDHKHDKRSVAIEIVNVGPLRRRGDQMCYWPPSVKDPNGYYQSSFKSPYCTVADTEKYVKLNAAFRYEYYFASFSHQQIEAVADLVNDVCTRNEIPKLIPSTDKIFKFDVPYFQEFEGVTSTVNWRAEKTDLAPGQSDPIWNLLMDRHGFKEQLGPL